MPLRILAFWLILCIGSPLCCCSKPVPSEEATTGSHSCCAKKQGQDKKEQGGDSKQCPHKKSSVEQIADTHVVPPSSSVQSVDVLPTWLDVVGSDALHERQLHSHDAQRWRGWVATPGSLSFCIRYHALLI